MDSLQNEAQMIQLAGYDADSFQINDPENAGTTNWISFLLVNRKEMN